LAPPDAGEIGLVAEETVQVEAARIPDRDRLVEELRAAGLDARAVGEVCIEVPCGGDAEIAADKLLAQTEHLITSLGAPFVPMKHEGVIYIRPPLS
jgi:hypothetical protein